MSDVITDVMVYVIGSQVFQYIDDIIYEQPKKDLSKNHFHFLNLLLVVAAFQQ